MDKLKQIKTLREIRTLIVEFRGLCALGKTKQINPEVDYFILKEEQCEKAQDKINKLIDELL